MGVFTIVALGARVSGDATPIMGTFMLNLGMSMAVIFAHGLTALISNRQFPDEIENRTLYPLLAKPLSRDSLLAGKWLACVAGGLLTFLAFHLIALLVSPAPEPYSHMLHVQHLFAQILSISWVAALGIALSLCLPRILALVFTLLLTFGSEACFHLLHGPWPIVAHMLPRFGAMNLTTRLTDGIDPLAFTDLLALFIYAAVWIILCLSAAHALWTRRAL
jgi:ABC-type transport system involved in multi-copper enzyme maturation permease subunit